jgi:hypothetical protein
MVVPVLEGGPYDINPEGGLAAAGWLNFELDGPAVEDVEASPSLATLKDILNGSNQSKGNCCDVSEHAAGARAYWLTEATVARVCAIPRELPKERNTRTRSKQSSSARRIIEWRRFLLLNDCRAGQSWVAE